MGCQLVIVLPHLCSARVLAVASCFHMPVLIAQAVNKLWLDTVGAEPLQVGCTRLSSCDSVLALPVQSKRSAQTVSYFTVSHTAAQTISHFAVSHTAEQSASHATVPTARTLLYSVYLTLQSTRYLTLCPYSNSGCSGCSGLCSCLLSNR